MLKVELHGMCLHQGLHAVFKPVQINYCGVYTQSVGGVQGSNGLVKLPFTRERNVSNEGLWLGALVLRVLLQILEENGAGKSHRIDADFVEGPFLSTWYQHHEPLSAYHVV